MVSAIDENYRGCHSYELAGGQKRPRVTKRSGGKMRNETLTIEEDKQKWA